MKSAWTPPALAGLAASLLLVSQLHAAAPFSASSRLDKRLAPIAEAAEERREGPLMRQALLRQSDHANSPFEARWNAAGAVQVYLHYAPGGAGPDIAALQSLGATDIVQSRELSVVQAWVPAGQLKAASTIAGVGRVGLPRYAIHKLITATGPRYSTGSVTTEGDQILGAAQFRGSTGITGQGITVGVISDGDDHIAASQKSGDLPANIVNDPNDAGSFKSKGDEGTAMMEIVYDLAPGVKRLSFCGPQTTADFITCLNDFAANVNANVIVDDLGFPGGAMFSDDTFNTAVQSFASAHPNIRLVAAAGNDAQSYWQGNFNSPTPAPVSTTVNGVHYTQAANFGTNSGPVAYLKITVPSLAMGDKIGYQVEWNDPWTDDPAAANDPNDYDVVVFDAASGGNAVACNQGINIGPPPGGALCTQDNSKNPTNTPGPQPIQGSEWTASLNTYYLEVLQGATGYGTPGPNLKILVFDATKSVAIGVKPVTPGSIFGHAALPYPAEISAGAIYAPNALSGIYSIESYSSQGPVEYGIAGATPQSILKPDFAAPDCVSITGAGGFSSISGGPPTFCGTSAAGPHIAGLIALLMAGYPSQSPYTLLQQAATQPGSPGQNGTFGFGVPIMTNLLSAGVYPVPAAAITAPASGASVNTGQAVAFNGSCTAAPGAGGVKYDWNFGSGSGIADSSQPTPGVTFNTAGTYTVTLTCTASSGTSTASTSVTINAPSKGGGSLGLLGVSGLGLIYLVRRRRPLTSQR
ncbi:MAG TPA: PKD domain-containing protein [Gammaproteobacteria bacterium]|nr:PKD domain-containing protein [Gammaproteobacteria bacterium]